MAISNHERVGKALDLLKAGLGPFAEREFANIHGAVYQERAEEFLGDDRMFRDKPIPEWDSATILKLMWVTWNEVFRHSLGHAQRSMVSELREVRNKWAHQEKFSSDDADRALDSIARLLSAVSAPEAEDVTKMKMELRRIIFEEQTRAEKRKSASTAVESQATGNLTPWREIVSPHRDVASGRYQQAEFAADLWQVHIGEGTDEYRDPEEFFRRTYLTDSLKRLLIGAVHRLCEGTSDPVIQLQTNFGGGKTHSMLALYHIVSGANPSTLQGIDDVLIQAESKTLPTARRVVLVGNRISPGNPVTKSDGTVVRTLWGELAWQLGGKEAFERVRGDDENSTSPGDTLRELFNDYGPCLILIDEWVAYARQLHEQSDLPAGSFETQFTFAQALTESAKLAKRCMVVVSLPASDTATSPHAQSDDTEVGGQRGREALERLRNVVGRVESSWRPASAEEGFEIVRRRLFEPIVSQEQYKARDLVARRFFDLYRTQHQEFPPECRESEYEKRIQAAYPIHPEVFDRLYGDWSTLVKFQRTRGVLRLMAAVIHCLWEKGDRNPLIQPANIPIDDPRVQFELTRYLSDNWVPVIERDVDGPNSLPMSIDGEVSNLGKYAATRRVARTIYLGSAPTATAANLGIEDRRIKLGTVMPDETAAVFMDGLRRLAAAATYLYQDGTRYWYSTQPTVTKLAEDRAEQLVREPDKVNEEIEARLRADLRNTGAFIRVHAMPQSGNDVPDDRDTRLVVLGPEQPYSKNESCPALEFAKEVLQKRGNAGRIFQNTLVFLAIDQNRLQDLDEAARRYLAWKSVITESEALNLSAHQKKQAQTQLDSAEQVMVARLPEAYQWALVPSQSTPSDSIQWEAIRLTGSDPLAVRASKRLRNDELLITSFAPSRLRMELDRIPLWPKSHVSVRQVIDYFASYIYLPRLVSSAVIADAIRAGVGLLTWHQDGFAYADSFDEDQNRYRGLRYAQNITVTEDDQGLLVKPDVALAQVEPETPNTGVGTGPTEPGKESEGKNGGVDGNEGEVLRPKKLRRYHGTVTLDPMRVSRDAGQVADEVITHLVGLLSADVRVTLEIEADIPDGAPDNIVRTVTENGRTLKFDSHGFEEE
jgi:predicted AAA+ superfamily ATPase